MGEGSCRHGDRPPPGADHRSPVCPRTARVAHARKVRRLTQRELADLSHVSYSTLTKVEQGVLPASPSVIGALARSARRTSSRSPPTFPA
ncbi:helix-turn-helix transcriptional regulator [Streptomyces sp. NPDC005970]|uniref:helix-turn-helix domain-containing protein n=1 Tax=Streptomyces sp. NPDC005970 TaxID=3156723 RepID=UPI0033F89F04